MPFSAYAHAGAFCKGGVCWSSGRTLNLLMQDIAGFGALFSFADKTSRIKDSDT